MKSSLPGRIEFVSTKPLTRSQLREAVYIQARITGNDDRNSNNNDRKQEELMVNNLEKFDVVLRPVAEKSDPEKISITDKGTIAYTYIPFL